MPMKFTVVTILPELIEPALTAGVVGRAREAGVITVDDGQPARLHARQAPHRRRHAVRRRPGHGDEARAAARRDRHSARGSGAPHPAVAGRARRSTQARVRELAKLRAPHPRVRPLRRHRRARDRARRSTRRSRSATSCSPAASSARSSMIDAVARLVPGVLGDATSADDESFSAGLLEYPQYTRPAELARPRACPRCCTSGNHAAIAAWRREQSLRRTARAAPICSRALPADARPTTSCSAPLARAHAPRARPSSGRRSHRHGRHDLADQLRHPRPRALVDDVRPRRLSHRHADHLAAREGRSTSRSSGSADEQGEHRAAALRLVRDRRLDRGRDRRPHGRAWPAPASWSRPRRAPSSFPAAARRTSRELLAEATIDPAPAADSPRHRAGAWPTPDSVGISACLRRSKALRIGTICRSDRPGRSILDRLFGRPCLTPRGVLP